MIFTCLAASVLAAAPLHAGDVFFVTGQSNAKAEFAQGVEETLRASGHFPDLRVVAVGRSGKAMNAWFDSEPAALYRRDFFSAPNDPPALLESAMLEGGGGHTFRALFWFQGESDAPQRAVENYAARFERMLDRLSSDLGHGASFASSGMRYHLALVDSTHPTVVVEGIREEQRRMVDGHSGFAGLADTREFVRPDGLHMMVEDLHTLGRRMANEYMAAVGLLPVVFEHDWTGAEGTFWAEGGNWERGRVPASDPSRHFARFGRVVASNTDPFVHESASIDGLEFSNAAGQSSWTLSGSHPLTLDGTLDARGVSLDLDISCLGNLAFKGRDSTISVSGTRSGDELHLGSHGMPGNHYRIRSANWFNGATGSIHLGNAKQGSTGGTRIDVEADQTVDTPVKIYGGRPEDPSESLVALKKGSRWIQEGGASLQVGDSNSTGNFWSSGRLLLDEGAVLTVLGGSAFEISNRGGTGLVDVRDGLLRVEIKDKEPLVLGGATFNNLQSIGKGGRGDLRLHPEGTLETARGFRSRRILPTDHEPILGQGTLRLMGGTLRLIGDGGTDGELDLLGSESGTYGSVSVELEGGWSTIDTNGFDAVSHVPFAGEGGWTKIGRGRLRFSGDGEIRAHAKIIGGEVVFDEPIRIPEDMSLELQGGTLRCPGIVNEGVLIIGGDSQVEVSGETVNCGTLDTSEWDREFEKMPENTGVWVRNLEEKEKSITVEKRDSEN